MGQLAYDVAVVGAGMLGAATAYRLAHGGARVALVEAATAGSGASGNSFAWLNSAGKEPDSYHRLNVAGMAEYDALERDLGIEVHRTGSLHVPFEPADLAALEARHERLRARGYAARWITRDECLEREPGLRLAAVATRVLALDDDAWVEPPSVIRVLLEAAGSAVDLYEHAPVTEVRRSGSSIEIRAGAQEVACDALVLCAGTGTPLLAQWLGAAVPVEAHPGLLAVTSAVPPGSLRSVVYHGRGAHDLHLRPDASGGIRIGSAATDRRLGDERSPHRCRSLADQLLRRAADVLPTLGGVEVERVHLGVRPVPRDGVTVAGRLPGLENAYVAVTHSGVTLGPLLGRLIADEVAGGKASPLLADFRPDRFVPAPAQGRKESR